MTKRGGGVESFEAVCGSIRDVVDALADGGREVATTCDLERYHRQGDTLCQVTRRLRERLLPAVHTTIRRRLADPHPVHQPQAEADRAAVEAAVADLLDWRRPVRRSVGWVEHDGGGRTLYLGTTPDDREAAAHLAVLAAVARQRLEQLSRWGDYMPAADDENDAEDQGGDGERVQDGKSNSRKSGPEIEPADFILGLRHLEYWKSSDPPRTKAKYIDGASIGGLNQDDAETLLDTTQRKVRKIEERLEGKGGAAGYLAAGYKHWGAMSPKQRKELAERLDTALNRLRRERGVRPRGRIARTDADGR